MNVCARAQGDDVIVQGCLNGVAGAGSGHSLFLINRIEISKSFAVLVHKQDKSEPIHQTINDETTPNSELISGNLSKQAGIITRSWH